MEKQRVNKVTGSFNADGGVTLTLYRTRNKLGTITNTELNIPTMEESGAQNKNVYMAYCKDFVINLLKNDGIEGYYYDDTQKSEQSANGLPSKFNKDSFIKYSKEIVESTIGKLLGDGYQAMSSNKEAHDVNVTESYKDGMIKYANVTLDVAIANDVSVVDIKVPMEIRSGQLCKPKVFITNEEEKKFNVTNLKKLLGGSEIASTKAEPVTETQANTQNDTVEHKDDQEEVKEVEQDTQIKEEAQEEPKKRRKGRPKKTEAKSDDNEDGHIDGTVSKVMGMFE